MYELVLVLIPNLVKVCELQVELRTPDPGVVLVLAPGLGKNLAPSPISGSTSAPSPSSGLGQDTCPHPDLTSVQGPGLYYSPRLNIF